LAFSHKNCLTKSDAIQEKKSELSFKKQKGEKKYHPNNYFTHLNVIKLSFYLWKDFSLKSCDKTRLINVH